MASLKDQLLKVGLTDKQSARNSRKNKQATKPKKERGQLSQSALAAQESLRDKASKDKELNRQKQLVAEQKAELAQIKQLVELSKIEREDAEQAYNFTHLGQIKTIYVTKTQRQQLAKNHIAIVATIADSFELVPLLVAKKIAQRDTSFVVAGNEISDIATDDDPYADYKIPDDLVW
jgi:uncharacterized protein YaiL (DUF2058 family)